MVAFASALRSAVAELKANPDLLHEGDLQFFRDYLESLGATIPPKKVKREKII